MKIGIISPYALPEKGAASMRVDSFQKHFNLKGHKTKIIAPCRGHGKTNSVIRYDNINSLKKIVKEFDNLIVTCPSFYTAFKIIPFLRIKKIPFVLDFRDLAENSNKYYNVFFQFFSLLFSKKVTVVTKYMKNYFIRKYKVNPKRICVISNGVDRDIFYPIDNKSKLRKRLGLPMNSKIVIYEGIVGDHGLEEFFKNIKPNVIVSNSIYFVFAFIVKKNHESEIKVNLFIEKIRKMGLSNSFRILKNISPSNLRDYISVSDVGLATIPSNHKNLYRVPIKAYEYLACNVPVVASGPINGELHKLILRANGFFVKDNNLVFDDLMKFLKKKNKKNDFESLMIEFNRNESAKKILSFLQKRF